MRKKETRNLQDLYSVGPATVRDLKLLGITAVGQLVGQDAGKLYDRLCRLSGKRCDPCMMDVLSAASPRRKTQTCRKRSASGSTGAESGNPAKIKKLPALDSLQEVAGRHNLRINPLQRRHDVITELAIITDGDEGLFAGYERIEFLAPVYAGDFLEVTGRIVRFGNTSRTVEFEAHKVIASCSDVSPSVADVLAERITTCRAIGTTVIPKAHARRAEILARGEGGS